MGKKTSDELVEAISKPKKKKENNMKKTIILTVLATVAVIALFAGTFVAGINYQKNYEKTISDKAQAIAKQQAVVSRVEESKK